MKIIAQMLHFTNVRKVCDKEVANRERLRCVYLDLGSRLDRPSPQNDRQAR